MGGRFMPIYIFLWIVFKVNVQKCSLSIKWSIRHNPPSSSTDWTFSGGHYFFYRTSIITKAKCVRVLKLQTTQNWDLSWHPWCIQSAWCMQTVGTIIPQPGLWSCCRYVKTVIACHLSHNLQSFNYYLIDVSRRFLDSYLQKHHYPCCGYCKLIPHQG